MVKKDPNKILKCKVCKEVFRETEATLKNAGTTQDGKTYYNTDCPKCGSTDRMGEDYVGVPDEVLEKLEEGEITYREAMENKDTELEKEEKNQA